MRCKHKRTKRLQETERLFVYCVADENCDPRAHGGIAITEVCEDCGASRRLNINGQYCEAEAWFGGWGRSKKQGKEIQLKSPLNRFEVFSLTYPLCFSSKSIVEPI